MNSQEKDNEIYGEGNSYTAEYWQYDARLGRRWNVDPVVVEWESSYSVFENNPLNMVDINGNSANPIYDTDGEFLGTDDKGLQGEAIVMKKEDFAQGMKHEDAVKKGVKFKDLPLVYSNEMRGKIDNHFATLPSRPDFDGKITLSEANKWYRSGPVDNEGNRLPLFADLSLVDLKFVSKKDFSKVGEKKSVQTFGNSEDGKVYGQIVLTYMGDNAVKSSFDIYNFEMHYTPSNDPNLTSRMKSNFKRVLRNMATFAGRVYADQSMVDSKGEFKIHFYGTGSISD